MFSELNDIEYGLYILFSSVLGSTGSMCLRLALIIFSNLLDYFKTNLLIDILVWVLLSTHPALAICKRAYTANTVIKENTSLLIIAII